MAQDKRPPSFADFDSRLDKFRKDTGLDQAEQNPGQRSGFGSSGSVRIGIELVAGVVGGVLFGYVLDGWFDTRPILLIVFFLLGAAAGMLNAYRYLQRMSKETERGDSPRA